MPPTTRSIPELKAEIRRKERALQGLLARRKKVLAQLAKIDREIMAIGGTSTGTPGPATAVVTGRTRGARRSRATGKPLAEYISSILSKSRRPVRARDVAAAVVKAGYPTHSKNFYGIVAAALRDESRFKRTGRGLYKLAK